MLKTKIVVPTMIVKKAIENQNRIAGEKLNYDHEIKRINAFKFAEMGESFDDALKHAGVELTPKGLASVNECGYTEVVLNKSYAQPIGVVFTTTGCDFNFKQYATAKKMSQDYNLPLVRINKAICRKRNNMKPNTDFELADLDRQINTIEKYVIYNNPKDLTVIKDVGSGLNDNRKGILQLINMIQNDEVSRIFITYKDRLTRFGFNFIKALCDFHNTEIVEVSSEVDNKTESEELAEDIIAIIHSFSDKLYSMRRQLKESVCKELGDDV